MYYLSRVSNKKLTQLFKTAKEWKECSTLRHCQMRPELVNGWDNNG